MPSKIDAVVNLGAEIPGYDLLAKLGGGGMGEVYLARRTGALGFEKLVALKTVLPQHKKRGTVEIMFLDEARTAARLNHPAIPQVYDFGEAGRTFYLAMEYIAGASFDAVSEMVDGPWPPGVAALAMAEACRGLHSAHTHTDLSGRPLRIIHRDVSPHNLLLSFEGRVKLIDFGIAITRGRLVHTTNRNEIRGKVRYMAPEQLQRKKLDFRADIFACGVVLYELLLGPGATKKLPLMGEAALDGSLEPLFSRNPDVSPALNAVVMRALRADPRERFESAKDMARALDEAGAGDLEEFAHDVLSETHREHQAWIRDLLDREPPSSTERATVEMPALPRRVTTSLHPLLADDPDDAPVHAAPPADGSTSPRLRPRPVRRDRSAPQRESLDHLEPPTAPPEPIDALGPNVPMPRALVLIGGGAGLALVAALLMFTLLRSPGSAPPAVDKPIAVEAPAPPSAEPAPKTPTQQTLDGLRQRTEVMVQARGLVRGDDARVDEALLILESAALEENLDRAHNAVRLAEIALADIQLDEPFLRRKLSRLRSRYDDVGDPAVLQRLNPLMRAVLEAKLQNDDVRMNELMNRAFGILNNPTLRESPPDF